MIARGSLGNPWIFAELTGREPASPSPAEIEAELRWVLDRGRRALGPRARGAQPAQVLSLVSRAPRASPGAEADRFQRTESLEQVRELLQQSGSSTRSGHRYNRRPCPSPHRRKAVRFGRFRCVQEAAAGGRRNEEEDTNVAREALITQEGLEKLKSEIEHLSTTKRREVAARIKEAREFGDIAENSEYDDAKNEQALLEQRIAQLEERLRRASVVDKKQIDTESVGVGVLRPRQGPEVRRLAQVPHRRPDRGRPGRAEALPRVADRQGAARPQARRRRHRRRPARAEEEAQDHQDRDRLAAVRHGDLGSPPMAEPERRRGALRAADPRRAAGEARAPARGRDRAVPARVRGPGRDRGRARGARRPRGRRGDRGRLPGRRPDRGSARSRQGGLHRPRRRQRQDPGPLARRRARRASRTSCSPSLDLGDIVGVDGRRVQDPPRRALAAGDRLDAAGQEPAPAARQVPRPRGHRAALPPPRARPDRQPGDARALSQPRRRRSPRCASTSTPRASSRSRRRCCSRSTAARWRGRSRPTTTRSTATSTCGSRPSSTSSA